MTASKEYSLIDCGEGRRLERVGDWIIDRPSPGSLMKKDKIEEWTNVDFLYQSHRMDIGRWECKNKKISEPFTAHFKDFLFEFRLSPSGQIGIFPEQIINWQKLSKLKFKKPLNLLNLFAYTGLSSVAALKGGHSICHIDSAKSIIPWAQKNASINLCPKEKSRWIVDDVLSFCKREVKRAKVYNAFVLDPPAFGRGSGKKTWKIQRDLPELLNLLHELSQGKPKLLILSAHQTGWSPQKLLEKFLEAFPELNKNEIDSHYMEETTFTHKTIQSGICCSYINHSS